MSATPKQYATESALCADFIAEVRRGGGWECYPETEGWDILLVRLADGFQIGIEAKLKLNGLVVSQALEENNAWNATRPGPDCRAILVPEKGGAFPESVCDYLGIVIIRMGTRDSFDIKSGRFVPGLSIWPHLPKTPKPHRFEPRASDWPEWYPDNRHPLPDYIPDSRAGSPSPIQLTPWKIAAIKIAIILESRPVVRADFKALGIDYGRWLPSAGNWLAKVPDGPGYVAGSRFPDFKSQHPLNYEQIKADSAKWMPAELPGPMKQAALTLSTAAGARP